MVMIRFLSSMIAAAVLSMAIAVAPPAMRVSPSDTLGDYVQRMKWDPAKAGPLIVVDPEHVAADHGASNLDAFHRKLFTVGKLSAIGPTEMVLIDESFKEGNLFDGISMKDKVIYLLSLLSPEQVDLATSNGISKADLQGEQIAVFNSLLPRPFSWNVRTLDANGNLSDPVDQGVLPDDQRDAVRLKIQSGLVFHVFLQNQPGAYSTFDSTMAPQKPGDKILDRDRKNDNERRYLLGVNPRQTVVNKPKESQLKYGEAAFDKTVTLPWKATISELLDLAGKATGVELHADLRVSGLNVIAKGTEARAGDLLEAIALSVTGTFRKVGEIYELTSDLEGLGQRQLVFAAWTSDASRLLGDRVTGWRRSIGKKGLLRRLRFDSKDPLAPDESARGELEQTDDKWTGDQVSTAHLGPAIQTYLKQLKAAPGHFYDTDKVGLHSQVLYSFVLPDGRTLRPEGKLGNHSEFTHEDQRATAQPAPAGLFAPDPQGNHALIVRAESQSDAMKVVDLARAHGFKNLWLETHDKSALVAAAQFGIQLSLVFRPWEATGQEQPQSIDRNILGNTANQVADRAGAEFDWKAYVDLSNGTGSVPPPFYDLAAPLDPMTSNRWSDFVSLAHAPKLVGTVILDPQPAGYEPTISNNSFANYADWLGALTAFGYSEKIRVEFLRKYGIDPIDIAAPNLRQPVELDQPFFLDGHLGGPHDLGTFLPALDGMPTEWQSYRAKLNVQGMEPLMTLLKDLTIPILAMPKPLTYPTPQAYGRYVVPWDPSTPLPVVDYRGPNQAPANRVIVFPLTAGSSPAALKKLGDLLHSGTPVVAVDASSLSVDDLGKLLDRYFPRVEPE
jgi:hypothetical protein